MNLLFIEWQSPFFSIGPQNLSSVGPPFLAKSLGKTLDFEFFFQQKGPGLLSYNRRKTRRYPLEPTPLEVAAVE